MVYFCLRSLETYGTNGVEAFKEFYKDKGRRRIPKRVEYFKAQLAVDPVEIKVIDLQNRWASCTPDGNLNFHWKCMMAPLTVIDYIVVHELAHLIHANHTEAFWNCVDKILPDYKSRKDWLRINGAGMDL